MYPWQSGSNGREETQTLHLNPHSGRWIPDHTHRQRHINVAIAYNIWQYYQVTEDHEFLYFYGARCCSRSPASGPVSRPTTAVSTAMRSRASWALDEYHTAYPGADPEAAGGILQQCLHQRHGRLGPGARPRRARVVAPGALLPLRAPGPDGGGPGAVGRAQSQLRVPLHGDGIISQFDGYGDLEPFDWPGYQERYDNIQRLDRILEAEHDTPNRYQVSKQADVLMLFYLLSADELALLFEQLGYPLSAPPFRRPSATILARTSHGSTLSRVVHAWVLARADRPRSWGSSNGALDSDIADIQGGTTREGIHVGAMAGTIDLIQRYLGLELRANVLYFDPVLPDELTRINVHALPAAGTRGGGDARSAADQQPLVHRGAHYHRLPGAFSRRGPGRHLRISPLHTARTESRRKSPCWRPARAGVAPLLGVGRRSTWCRCARVGLDAACLGHARSAATARRGPALPPVLTRDT